MATILVASPVNIVANDSPSLKTLFRLGKTISICSLIPCCHSARSLCF